jgi:precorrin-3B methylase
MKCITIQKKEKRRELEKRREEKRREEKALGDTRQGRWVAVASTGTELFH